MQGAPIYDGNTTTRFSEPLLRFQLSHFQRASDTASHF